MFALWCAVKSPLMLGSDLREMTVEDDGYQVGNNVQSSNLTLIYVLTRTSNVMPILLGLPTAGFFKDTPKNNKYGHFFPFKAV